MRRHPQLPQHYSAVWKPPTRTQQQASFPWTFNTFPLKSRRPRFSDEKEHACDVPGCRKTFYDRGNMLRHQRLKHGRQIAAHFTQQQICATGEMVSAVHNGAAATSQSNSDHTVVSTQSDAVVPSQECPVSQGNPVPSSNSEVVSLP